MELSVLAMDGSSGGDFTDRMVKHIGVSGAVMIGRHCRDGDKALTSVTGGVQPAMGQASRDFSDDALAVAAANLLRAGS